MDFNYINPHAEIPLFKAAWETVKELGNKAMSFGGAIASGIASVTDSALAGIGSITDSLPSMPSMSRGHDAPELARVREPEIAPPAKAYEVHMSEIGTLTPPPLPTNVGRGGVGLG